MGARKDGSVSVAYDLFFPGLIRKTGISQRPAGPFGILQLFLDPFNILQTQLGLNDLHVTYWVHVSLYVGYFVIIKRADDLEYSVDRSHV